MPLSFPEPHQPLDVIDHDDEHDDDQARLDEHIDQLVRSWPKPTAEQLGRLRRLFTQPSAERVSA